LYREVFSEVFGDLTGVTMPPPPRPADGTPGSGSGPEANRQPARTADFAAPGGLDRYAGRYERISRQFDVSVRDGQLRMLLTMTGNLAALTASEPEDLLLHPAGPPDPAVRSSTPGTAFVLRSRDDEPWVPLSFAELGDGTPYIYLSGRVTPRVG
jgi:hypothetical protein